jgi:hypothetical protein
METKLEHLLKPSVDKSISEDYYNADMYIKMAHIVTSRAYWAFSVMAVVCIMTLVVLFNHYYSYEEYMYKKMNILLRLNNPTKDTLDKNVTKNTVTFGTVSQSELIKELKAGNIFPLDSLSFIKGENPISKRIRENFISNHIEASYISIPILGIKVSVNDILFVMSFTFLILSAWLYLCIRSENFTVGKILSLNQTKNIDIRRYIFYGICFNNMFFPTTQRRKAYSTLSNIAKSLCEELKDIPIKSKRPKWRNEIVFWIFFIPLVIMVMNLCIHCFDILSVISDNKEYTTIKYNIRENDKDTTKTYFINDSKIARMDSNDVNICNKKDPYRKYLWWIFGISASCVFALSGPCYKSYRYQKGTSKVLYHFKQRFKHDDDCHKCIDYYQLKESRATIQVVATNSKTIFSAHRKYQEYKKSFVQKYSMENGFYFLTHSGDRNEVNRLKDELSKNSNYSNAVDIYTGDETNKKEYFIFLEKSDK